MPVDDAQTRRALDAIMRRVELAAGTISVQGALAVQGLAQRRLHVGYGVVSGTMRRSVHIDGPTQVAPGVYSTRVGPGVIYARRFELGFAGPDSLGRVFNQQPRPFMRPAASDGARAVEKIARRIWGGAFRG